MTLQEAKVLARTLRRQLLLASVSRVILAALLMTSFLAALLQSEADAGKDALWFATLLTALTWVTLTMFSVRQIRAANQASAYISSGRLDLAEEQLRNAVHLFSLYRSGKLLACHNLAVVVHGRKDYQAAAELCDCVIHRGGKVTRGAGRLCRILLADCRLLLGDPAAALAALEPLRLSQANAEDGPVQGDEAASSADGEAALNLAEQLLLLPVEIRCQVETGRFAQAVQSLTWKVRLAELLDSPKAALVHVLLAEACRRAGKSAEAAFLQRRAELYCDLAELETETRAMMDSARKPVNADNNTDIAP